MSNSFRDQEQGLQAVFRAARVISHMFSQTIGPYGFSTIVHNVQDARTTQDSQSMLKDILFPDVFENIGMKLIRDTALRTRMRFGDGAKTTALLIEALLAEGMTGIQKGLDPHEIHRGMLLAEKKIQEVFYRETFPLSDLEHTVYVSSIARRCNSEIASVLSSAVGYGGKNGYYIVEEHEEHETYWHAEEHAVWDFGYASPYFITHAETGTVEYSQVYILVSEQPLHYSNPSFLTFLQSVVQAGKTPLVILAEAFDKELLAMLEMNQIERVFPVCAVKVSGKHARESLEDIAVLTGATLLSEMDFEDSEEERITNRLGFVAGICVSSTSLCVPRETDNKQRMAEHCAFLQDKLSFSQEEEASARLRRRLARLSSGEVCIHIAADCIPQEEIGYITSSIRAMTESLRSGCLPGGGCAFIRAAREISVPLALSPSERFGFLAVLSAAEKPFRAIVTRSRRVEEEVFSEVFSQADWRVGFNGVSGFVEDIVSQGICDGASCIQYALSHAVGTTGLLLTSALFIASQEPMLREENSEE